MQDDLSSYGARGKWGANTDYPWADEGAPYGENFFNTGKKSWWKRVDWERMVGTLLLVLIFSIFYLGIEALTKKALAEEVEVANLQGQKLDATVLLCEKRKDADALFSLLASDRESDREKVPSYLRDRANTCVMGSFVFIVGTVVRARSGGHVWEILTVDSPDHSKHGFLVTSGDFKDVPKQDET